MKKAFTATLEAGSERGTMTFFVLPFDPKAVFGHARAPVVCTLNGKTSWRTSVSVYGGQNLLGVRAEVREAAGLKAGDRVKVVVEHDTKPRVVEAPADLKK
ncbi:MAG TPA: DUF1905 domain-containing protein, partial [Archangium sp.]